MGVGSSRLVRFPLSLSSATVVGACWSEPSKGVESFQGQKNIRGKCMFLNWGTESARTSRKNSATEGGGDQVREHNASPTRHFSFTKAWLHTLTDRCDAVGCEESSGTRALCLQAYR